MISYSQIIELYGTPISKIPVPNVPYKLKNSHVIIGLIVVGFACYGVYKFTQAIPKPKPVTENESIKK